MGRSSLGSSGGLPTAAPKGLRSISGIALVVVAGMAALAAACAATARGPSVIHLRDLPLRPAFNIEWVRSNRAAAAMAMAVIEHELGVPRLDATLHFFPDRETFRGALIDNGYDAAFAEQTASRMDAIGGYRRVLFNEASVASLAWPQRVGFFAHELTHTLQYEIGGGRRGTSDQWLREGFADWVAMRVVGTLDVSLGEAFRQRRLEAYRARKGVPLPRLEQMVTFPQWVAGSPTAIDAGALVAKAFLAAEFLIERHGKQAVLAYFTRFAQNEDRHANFVAAFGDPLPTFEAALDGHLKRFQ